MTAADIAYVDHDPLIPTHLGTDAPHVHVRSTDRCLRRPEGVECLSPAELRAEVERLRDQRRDMGRLIEGQAADLRATSAERDALQQRLTALAEDIRSINAFLAHTGDTHDAAIYGAALAIADRIDDALGGPAAPPQEPQPTPEVVVIVSATGQCREPSKFETARRNGGVCGATFSAHSTAEVEAWLTEHYATTHAARQSEPVEPQPESKAMCGAYVGQGWDQEDDCHCVLRPEHAGWCRCAHQMVGYVEPESEPVERITDANGDETERGADTDTENTHQQDGDHR